MRTLWKLIKTLFKIIVWTILIALLLVIILYLSAGKLVQHFARLGRCGYFTIKWQIVH